MKNYRLDSQLEIPKTKEVSKATHLASLDIKGLMSKVSVDTSPIRKSNKPITSGAVYDAIEALRRSTSGSITKTISETYGLSTFASLEDTSIATPADAQVALFDGTVGKWRNNNIHGGYGIATPVFDSGIGSLTLITDLSEASVMDLGDFSTFETPADSGKFPMWETNSFVPKTIGDVVSLGSGSLSHIRAPI